MIVSDDEWCNEEIEGLRFYFNTQIGERRSITEAEFNWAKEKDKELYNILEFRTWESVQRKVIQLVNDSMKRPRGFPVQG